MREKISNKVMFAILQQMGYPSIVDELYIINNKKMQGVQKLWIMFLSMDQE